MKETILFVAAVVLLVAATISSWSKIGAVALLPFIAWALAFLATWRVRKKLNVPSVRDCALNRFSWYVVASAIAIAITILAFGLYFPTSEKLWEGFSEIATPLLICLVFIYMERKRSSPELTDSRPTN